MSITGHYCVMGKRFCPVARESARRFGAGHAPVGLSFVYPPVTIGSGYGERSGVALVKHFSHVTEGCGLNRQPRLRHRPELGSTLGGRVGAANPVAVKRQITEGFENLLILHATSFDANGGSD